MRDLKLLKKEIGEFSRGEESFLLGVRADAHYSHKDFVRKDGFFFPKSDLSKFICFSKVEEVIPLSAIADLGDLARGYEFDTLSDTVTDFEIAVKEFGRGVKCPTLYVNGNHDSGVLWTQNSVAGSGNKSIAETLTPAFRRSVTAPVTESKTKIFGDCDKLYYYTDICGIRIIVLDTSDADFLKVDKTDADINRHAVSGRQLKWFETEALNTENPVLILAHSPLTSELTDFYLPADNFDKMLSVVDSFKNGGGKIIAFLHGHTHKLAYGNFGGINAVTFPWGGENAYIVAISLKFGELKAFSLGENGSDFTLKF